MKNLDTPTRQYALGCSFELIDHQIAYCLEWALKGNQDYAQLLGTWIEIKQYKQANSSEDAPDETIQAE